MAHRDVKDRQASIGSRDPRKVFLRSSVTKQSLSSDGGSQSGSQSDLEVSTSGGSGSLGRNSFSQLDSSSLKSPDSPFGNPLSLPSLPSLNSPFSDFGPLSVSDFLKSPEACQVDTDSMTNSQRDKEDQQSVENSDRGQSSAQSEPKTPHFYLPQEENSIKQDENKIPEEPSLRLVPDSQTPTCLALNFGQERGRESYAGYSPPEVHVSNSHLLERLFASERQRETEKFEQFVALIQTKASEVHNRTVPNTENQLENLHATSACSASPVSKFQELEAVDKPHSTCLDFLLKSRLGVASAAGHSVTSGEGSYLSAMRDMPYPGSVNWEMNRTDSPIPVELGGSNPTSSDTVGHQASGHQYKMATAIKADLLADQTAVEMLQQEVFKSPQNSHGSPSKESWPSCPIGRTRLQRRDSSKRSQQGWREGSESAQQQRGECKFSGGVGTPTDHGPSSGNFQHCNSSEERDISYNNACSSSEPQQPNCSTEQCRDQQMNGDKALHLTGGDDKGLFQSQVNSVSTSVSEGLHSQDRIYGNVESTRGEVEVQNCQICGDIAAGFHCGAYVCEACKKFFVRCLKQEQGLKFVCPRNRTCVISKETRTQCQHCRYKKCLQIGMYRPGGTNISSEIGHIPCSVCTAPSSGYHFGAITCEGCKGFFRRTIKERDSMKYQCSRNGSCTITTATRNVCKFCRYKKCLDVGMKSDGSRIGRQPNSVKHATMIQLKQIKSKKGLDTAELPVPLDCSSTVKEEPKMDSGYGANIPCQQGYPANPSPTVSLAGSGSLSLQTVSQQAAGGFSYTHLPGSRVQSPSQPAMDNTHGMYVDQGPSDISHSSYPDPHQDEPINLAIVYNNFGSPSTREDASVLPSLAKESPHSYSRVNSSNSEVAMDTCVPMDTDSLPYTDAASNKTVTDTSHSGPPSEVETQRDAEMPNTSTNCSPSNSGSQSSGSVLSSDSPDTKCPEELDKVIECLEKAVKFLEPIQKRNDNMDVLEKGLSPKEVWDGMMAQFSQCALAVLKFSKKVPGFKKMPIQDQIATVQSCMYPVVTAVLALTYDLEKKKYNYFNMTDEEESLIHEIFPPFKLIRVTLHNIGMAVQQIGMNFIEVAFLCALHLMSEGSLKESQELMVSALEHYCKKTYGETTNRHGLILLRLSELVKANLVHHKAVSQIMSDPVTYKGITIPQLFQETFINT